MARPRSVRRCSASSAPRSARSFRASASAARGGGSRNWSRVGSATPQAAQSRSRTREIGVEDFGRREGWKRGRRGVLPQPVANSGADPAGAPASLIGRSARDPHRLEPGDADIGLVHRNAGEAAIDHDADIGEREARLGDRGREHELAPARWGGRDGTILPFGFEPAVQRQDVQALPLAPEALLQERLRARDLSLAREEDEDAALLLRERAAANSRHGLLDALAWRTPDMARLDRESPAFARQHRRVAEKRRDARSIERRGHDDEAQILAQPRLRVERERKTEIRIERAFMEFIEDHRSDVGERRILENEAGEHALGHNLEAGIAREARTEPHAKPDRPANLFA